MSEHDFEQRLAWRLRDYSDAGLRPFDALEIARTAMSAGRRRAPERDGGRLSVPGWLRALALAGLLLVLLLATAIVGGLVELPPLFVVPTPAATSTAQPSATLSPQPTVTDQPSPTPSPQESPTPSPTPSPSPSPTPSPSPSPTPSPPPVIGWREIGDFPAGQSDSATEATYGPAGFVMVTVASGGGNSWVSADGTNWTRSTDGGFDGASHLVARAGEYIAIGPVRGDAGRGVWRSTDGLNWTLLTTSPVLEFVNDMTVDNDGLLIAVGTSEDFDAARVWTSMDGVTWTSIAAPETSSELSAVTARDGDIVALGDDFTGYGRVIWFRAAQAGGWSRFDAYGEDNDGRLIDLATNGRLFVAVGYEDDFDTGVRTPTIRSSANGTNWITSIVVSDSGVDVFEQLVVLPDGRLLAVGSRRSYSGSGEQLTMREVGYSYVSADATSWGSRQPIWERTEQVGSDIGDQIERYRAVAAGDPGAVVADEDRPKVFFSPLADLR